MTEVSGRGRVQASADQRGVPIEFISRGPASSVEEAAANLGIETSQIVKTLVAKAKRTQSTTDVEYVLALIPGDKAVDWAKLRKLAGFKKMSMASPDEGFEATGYRPGTINPFGTTTSLPVFADDSISGRIAMGAGEPDLNLFVDSAELFAAFGVTAGDIGK
ncbi:aminoacyl-tRNA deacylase [Nesterenkonia flava]|uniref:YbaK/EbsC family protein n=1 Tax=Nesterenkonia flava TaxID=469799 RepID=A0ABU1FT60_9MICC|nr:YbaK/EbsC family protein [Nesterenkonia flava]MDR5711840.1 YbaK/EbsC family protein [Nesterenkonia flava]